MQRIKASASGSDRTKNPHGHLGLQLIQLLPILREKLIDGCAADLVQQWNEVFAGVTIVSAILDRVPHHCTVISIKGESYRLKGRKEFMRQKQQTVNTLLVQGNTWFLLPPQKNDKISSAFSYNFKSALTPALYEVLG